MNTSINTLSFKRTFHASIDLVWKAYTEPEYISKWWSPQGMETAIVHYNFKAGGAWQYIMKMPNDMEFIAEGKFKEIIPMKKILTEANFKPKTEGVGLEILFEPESNTTQFTLNVIHPTEAYKIQQEKMGVANGWEAALARFAELIWNIT
ncbi:hypothetical protein MTsPCn9_10150 [Croceitalea sp. MTPC9]|uniref:SRPBCC family protein n=1 Tax=unclassified Croceitalea TaxID=2632280 RepID=UPI002B3E8F02|nr:hypothetical protein MTsPCn6_27090 [Croceitalea sp. MTPC6]GMN16079.1 hypothetical protein MTsPCn9_10150 [Croceitalea sp. MTPC9]